MIETFFTLGEDNEVYFKGTYIESLGEKCLSQAMKYFVWSSILNELRRRIMRNSFLIGRDFSLLYQKATKAYRLESENRPWMEDIIKQRGSEALLKTSLDRLTREIADRCGKIAILLVDEYDSPMEKAYREGYYERVQPFLKAFLGDVLKETSILKNPLRPG